MVAYRARVYEKGDDEQIVDLLETSFDGWPKFDIQCSPLEHWRWKYLDNPIGPLLVFVAEKQGIIVGSYHSIPCLVNIEGHTVLGINDADVCTHPDHRRKGVYNMILDFLEPIIPKKDVFYWYGIESNPILIKKHIRDGTTEVAPHKAGLYIKVKDLDRRARAQQVDDLFKKVKSYYQYCIERDSDYLNWRYCDPRGGRLPYLVCFPREESSRFRSVENKSISGRLSYRVHLGFNL